MKRITIKAFLCLALGVGSFCGASAQSIVPATGGRQEPKAPKQAAVSTQVVEAPVTTQPTAKAAPAQPQAVKGEAPAKGVQAVAKPTAVPQRDLTPDEQAQLARQQQNPDKEAIFREIQAKVTAAPGTRAAAKEEYHLVNARVEALQAARGEAADPNAEEVMLKHRLEQLLEELNR